MKLEPAISAAHSAHIFSLLSSMSAGTSEQEVATASKKNDKIFLYNNNNNHIDDEYKKQKQEEEEFKHFGELLCFQSIKVCLAATRREMHCMVDTRRHPRERAEGE